LITDQGILGYLNKRQYGFLLISISLLISVPSFLPEGALRNLVQIILFSQAVLASLLISRAISGKNLLFLLVASITFIIQWINLVKGETLAVHLIMLIISIIFWGWVTISVLRQISKENEVSIQVIYGAISGYILIGLIGAMVAAMIELVIPGSYNFSVILNYDYSDFFYFSFVTLTTLGYGDITPVNRPAETLSIVLSLAGQLYMTILIAILIGKFLIRKRD